MVALAFGTPRKLPSARTLQGRVVVLDIAFAYDTAASPPVEFSQESASQLLPLRSISAPPRSPSNFAKVTKHFIDGLGPRLAAWVDHHDHERHADYASDPRFLLRTKAQHGACPEMISKELVERIWKIDTIVCHTDFDGLCAAAKWLRSGLEPYPGADDDARAIDTRIGTPSPTGIRFDRALRGRPRDEGLFGLIVRHLTTGLEDAGLWGPIDTAAGEYEAQESEARRLARGYVRLRGQPHGVAFVDVTPAAGERLKPYDKTLLLLLGQEREPISVVVDRDSVALAAAFTSGIDFLALLGLSGGMPTRVSVPRTRLDEVFRALGVADPPPRS